MNKNLGTDIKTYFFKWVMHSDPYIISESVQRIVLYLRCKQYNVLCRFKRILGTSNMIKYKKKSSIKAFRN